MPWLITETQRKLIFYNSSGLISDSWLSIDSSTEDLDSNDSFDSLLTLLQPPLELFELELELELDEPYILDKSSSPPDHIVPGKTALNTVGGEF